MKTTHAISTLALVAALVATPVFAEDSNNSLSNVLNNTVDTVQGTVSDVVGGVENSADAETGDVDGEATGSIGDVSNSVGDLGSFGDFLNDFNAGNLDNGVGDIGSLGDVSVVDVGSAFDDFDANALNDALSNNSTQVAELHNALSGNSVLNDYLNGNNISVSDVLGISNNQDGSLIIYTNSDD